MVDCGSVARFSTLAPWDRLHGGQRTVMPAKLKRLTAVVAEIPIAMTKHRQTEPPHDVIGLSYVWKRLVKTTMKLANIRKLYLRWFAALKGLGQQTPLFEQGHRQCIFVVRHRVCLFQIRRI